MYPYTTTTTTATTIPYGSLLGITGGGYNYGQALAQQQKYALARYQYILAGNLVSVHVTDLPKPKTFREELQGEVNNWLAGV